MADPFDEDADIRSHLAALGSAALAELRRILEGPSTDPTAILRALTARPASVDLATLIAMADTDEVAVFAAPGDPGPRCRDVGPDLQAVRLAADIRCKARSVPSQPLSEVGFAHGWSLDNSSSSRPCRTLWG